MGVFLLLYLVSFAVTLAGGPGARWMWTTSLYLVVQGVLTFLILVHLTRTARAILITSLLFFCCLIVEFVGVTFSVPFGPHYFSYFLQPFVAGNVPLAILCIWYILVVNAYLVLRAISTPRLNGFRLLLAVAVFVAALDVLLEPFAAFINGYWKWIDGVVPIRNYVTWFLLALLFAAVLHRWSAWRVPEIAPTHARMPGLVLGLNALQFTAVNLLHGHVLATAVAWAIMGVTLAGARGRLRL